MKKIMTIALVALMSATAFAQDAKTAMKEIKKAKDYNEAKQLVESSMSVLTDNADKAAAYNKLVELAIKKFNDENSIATENQLAKQLGKEEKPYDKAGMDEAAYNAVLFAIECNKYDQLPNAKGKVAPKFAAKNAQSTWNVRRQLVNAGQDAQNVQDHKSAKKYWQAFIDTDSEPLFADCDRAYQQDFFAQVARIVAIYAYQDKEIDAALKYCDVAMKDPKEKEAAMNLKLEVLGSQLTTREDSVAYLNNVKEIYAQNPENGTLLEKVYNMYSSLGDKAAALKVLDDALAVNPKNFIALADKGIYYMDEENAAEASKYFRMALEVDSKNAVVNYYLAICLRAQAQAFQGADDDKFKAMLGEAVSYFDKTKELDPTQASIPWGYNRYSAYVQLYGENDARTKEAGYDK